MLNIVIVIKVTRRLERLQCEKDKLGEFPGNRGHGQD